MRVALLLLLVVPLLGSSTPGASSVPDPDYCTVLPMDQMDIPRIIGVPSEEGSSDATLHIWIRAFGGQEIEDAYVEVLFNGSCHGDLCICDAASFTGYTGGGGYIAINAQLGGCCREMSAAIVLAEGVGIRMVDYVVSPDWDGASGNCRVELEDFIVFSAYFGQPSGVTCADYTGDEVCNLDDFIVFGRTWAATCVPGF